MRSVPMIQVGAVAASSAWYQSVLGLRSGHGGDEYEMLFAGEPHRSPMVLQLHRWDAHEHGLPDRPDATVGLGSSVWFEVDDRAEFDAAWARVEALAPGHVLAGPSWNPLAHHHEFAVQDLDGYIMFVHTPFSADAE